MHNDNLIKVLDHDNLKRDPLTNAIIDTDDRAYMQYLSTKESRLKQMQQITRLEDRINNFESDLTDIKFLLQKLLEK
jgi:hypothetical protein